jgi:hypothetical protein
MSQDPRTLLGQVRPLLCICTVMRGGCC